MFQIIETSPRNYLAIHTRAISDRPTPIASNPRELVFLKASPTASSPPSPPSTSTPATASTTSRAAPISSFFPGLVLWFRCIVDEKRVERETVGQDEVANVRAADVDRVEGDSIATFRCHLDSAQSSIHLRRDGGDRAVDDCACCEITTESR